MSMETKSIIHPTVDVFCVGLLSVFVITWIMAFQPDWTTDEVIKNFVFLTMFINFPHFISTYVMLYTSPTTVKNYPWSSIWLPLLLAVYCVFATLMSPIDTVYTTILTFVAGAYLAWHYTGQTWGMIAVFSHLGANPFNKMERTLVRTGLRVFLAFHLFWFGLHFFAGKGLAPEWITESYPIVSAVLLLTGAALGSVGFVLNIRRHARFEVRALAPFLAVIVWYIALSFEPKAIFWVQIGHSIQYLIFPFRVEVNQSTERDGRFGWWQAFRYLAILALLSLAVFGGLPWIIERLVSDEKMKLNAIEALVAFVNIHHFFADGALWKVSNPEVRKRLFSHLKSKK